MSTNEILLIKPLDTTCEITTQDNQRNYIHEATSHNTRKAYQADIRHFIAWGGLLPATSDIVIQYLHAYASSLNSRTLSRRLIAIKNWHVYQGFRDPTQHPLVKKTMSGIHHVHGKPKLKARAIHLEDLHALATNLLTDHSLIALRNCALLLIGFYGAFRRSELVNIRFDDLHFSQEGVQIMIRRSKTDQAGEGTVCAIPYNHHAICPVKILTAWLDQSQIASGLIFRAIKKEHITDKGLNAQNISRILKILAMKLNLAHSHLLSSHSLRRGFATTASKRGVSFVSIMRHGRWRHEGTVMGYIEEGRMFEDNALLKLYEAHDMNEQNK